MSLEMLWKIDCQYLARIEGAKKKVSLYQNTSMSPHDDDWLNAFDERERAVHAHTAWINRVFRLHNRD